mmetsp:Transcript_8157/g.9477  ORF Transcript_8157/g.9477 Transcript_8157/m.9477 type:complete len:197 (-) Transcript_8157:714-1304(-)|eukprot:CAMPEP_0197846994 /NCGR_PEP_ID=MMETSP1438-20131217/4876_1 /TAXON_ID=1461541 /ORGANISM="Pterosperma sp., Strain CCMP1384" /LENGTH=196 /DNA_ID=CAMNT_0043458789 /DNA_START=83 /DNA_END=673 /DNA_ORIENTATION=+
MAEKIKNFCPNDKVADLVMWTDPKKSGAVFGGITVAYYLLEKSGYTFLALLSNIALFSIIISCVWSSVSTVIGRGQPAIPKLEITETVARSIADKVVSLLNKAFSSSYTVLTGADLKLSVKCAFVAWLCSKVGGWFHLLTLVYLVTFVGFVFPKVYILKEKEIDQLGSTALVHLKTYYATIENTVLSKIPSKAKAN